jgi:uncharacterized membrane protein
VGLNSETYFKGGEEMQKKTWGFIFTVVGIIILLISLFGDLIGIGGYPGLGYKQIIGIIIGVIIIIIGFIWHRKS